jgi:hypothetical protein
MDLVSITSAASLLIESTHHQIVERFFQILSARGYLVYNPKTIQRLPCNLINYRYWMWICRRKLSRSFSLIALTGSGGVPAGRCTAATSHKHKQFRKSLVSPNPSISVQMRQYSASKSGRCGAYKVPAFQNASTGAPSQLWLLKNMPGYPFHHTEIVRHNYADL